ncbi:eCIS core domain-containing protein [Rhodohalobacter sulfatireducens]|uniref:DUF4157 domain-containing protein n=1 Tax=Rhodohalobacter sulfatireducens TaxID=2911366 RepID=A0ABS9KGE3_9BACT|nr:DUF4157 domain-containing protein [Rhodohalobacter sulfatireducens]MCG2589934.1 DUF4157 domain-containing protein [Rhodohalobacter sulfatireducens]
MKTAEPKSQAVSTHSWSPNSMNEVFFHANHQRPNSFFAPATIQPKLQIGEPNDKYEKQADRVADAVVQMPHSAETIQRQAMEEEEMVQAQSLEEDELQMQREPIPQRKCKACAEESLQKKATESGGTGNTTSEQISDQLESKSGSGNRLPVPIESEMSQKIGADFSSVNIHTDSEAVQMSQSLGARAFTQGNDIYFNSGEYRPQSSDGKHLLAHELTHVVQQNKLKTVNQIQRNVVDDDGHVPCRNTRAGAVGTLRTAEQEAVRLARRASGEIWTHLILHPLISIGGESQSLHDFRDALWRRFHFDYNDETVRETHLPLLARRYDLVAQWISNLDHRYVCAGPGNEPPGECTDQPGVGMAWTANGINTTELCESFWTASADDRAETILHEWFHFGFGWLGDCGEAHNRNNTVCFDMFAGELAGTATPSDYDSCCVPPTDPLPPLQGIP